MWQKFLSSPDMATASMFNELLYSKYPYAANFIPTGRARSVLSPAANSRSQKLFTGGLGPANSIPPNLAQLGVLSSSGRAISQLSQRIPANGISSADVIGSRQLLVLEQILGVLRHSSTRNASSVSGAAGGNTAIPNEYTGRKTGKTASAGKIRSPRSLLGYAHRSGTNVLRRHGGLGGELITGSLGLDAEGLLSLDPVALVAGLGLLGAGIAYKGWSALNRMSAPAEGYYYNIGRLSRLTGTSSRYWEIQSGRRAAGAIISRNELQKMGFGPQEAIALAMSYGVSGKTNIGSLAQAVRTGYLGGLPSEQAAGVLGSLQSMQNQREGVKGGAKYFSTALGAITGHNHIQTSVAVNTLTALLQGASGTSGGATLNKYGLAALAANMAATGTPQGRTGAAARAILAGNQGLFNNLSGLHLAVTSMALSPYHSLAQLRRATGDSTLGKNLSPAYRKMVQEGLQSSLAPLRIAGLSALMSNHPEAMAKLLLKNVIKPLGAKSPLEQAVFLSSMYHVPFTTAASLLQAIKHGSLTQEQMRVMEHKTNVVYTKSLTGPVKAAYGVKSSYESLQLTLSSITLSELGKTLSKVNAKIGTVLAGIAGMVQDILQNMEDRNKPETGQFPGTNFSMANPGGIYVPSPPLKSHSVS
ncbi:MAG: hypothetical protein ACYCOU_12050 [Sulfobacillus sp.]